MMAAAHLADLLAAIRFTEPPAIAAGVLALTIGVLLAAVRWFPFGLAAVMVLGLVAPLSIDTGTATPLHFTVLVLPMLAAVWLCRCAWMRDWRWARARANLPVIAFALTAALSFALANAPGRGTAPAAPLFAQLGGLAVFVLSATVFLMAADQIRDDRGLRLVGGALIAAGAFYALRRVFPLLRAETAGLFQPGSEGSVFPTWVAALASAQAMFNRNLSIELRIALATVVLVGAYNAVTENPGWAGGWLPPLVAVGVTLCAGAPRLAAGITVGAVAVAAIPAAHVIERVLREEHYSVLTRLAAWRALAEITAARPLLGLGPANYYHATPMHPILGWDTHFSSHNTYVDLVAQTGLVGFACFVWLVWTIARLGWRLRARISDGFGYAYVVGCLGGLAGTLAAGMLGDWLLPFVYNVGLAGLRSSLIAWLCLGALVGLNRTCAPVEPCRVTPRSG